MPGEALEAIFFPCVEVLKGMFLLHGMRERRCVLWGRDLRGMRLRGVRCEGMFLRGCVFRGGAFCGDAF